MEKRASVSSNDHSLKELDQFPYLIIVMETESSPRQKSVIK